MTPTAAGEEAVLDPRSVAVVYGTRPEIIKLAPLIKLLGPAARLINTGQHFDSGLSYDIARELSVPDAEAALGIGGGSRASQIAAAISGLEAVIDDAQAVVVQGDTNSALAGALAANAMEIVLFHVEAGLRSHDRRMPEEHNRVLIDHVADTCWAPTDGNARNLEHEGIPDSRIQVTGNSIVEALDSVRPTRAAALDLQKSFGLKRRGYVLVTLHRPENVDDAARLGRLLDHLAQLALPVVFPMHPRTLATIDNSGLNDSIKRLKVVPPLPYSSFLGLLDGCALAISDSGGVQEEVSILKVPLIVLRRSTERPEVIGSFASLTDNPEEMMTWANGVLDNVDDTFARLQRLPSPFGDGKASTRMYESMLESLQ